MLDRSLSTLRGGYLLDELEETPKDALKRIAKRVAELTPSSIYDGDLEKVVFDYMWKGYICPSSPVWSNFGTDRGLPISCFGSYVEDSISGIYGTLKENAKMSQLGGGTSSYWGEVRERGSKISGQTGSTGGVFEFLGNYDSMIKKVSQGGTRRGSHAVYIPFSHGDLMELLDIKKVGNEIQELFYGVSITKSDYELIYSGDEVALNKWSKILESRNQTGLPYIFNHTNMNAGESTPEWIGIEGISEIHASNLCFTGDTMVAVADGTNAKSIKELAEWSKGELKFPVYSAIDKSLTEDIDTTKFDSWVPEVKNAVAFSTGFKKVIKIVLHTGATFRCTENHELALHGGGYVEASKSKGKELSAFFKSKGKFHNGNNLPPEWMNEDSVIGSTGLSVVDIIDEGEIEEVYDLTVEDNHNFYIFAGSYNTVASDSNEGKGYGVLVHNCSEIALPSNKMESFVCCFVK